MPNASPIVLVHGFFTQVEAPDGTKNWGRFHGDLAHKLRLQGHEVYTASVGPFSSNWDRACELYAQIKGGRVDYGENHSAHHGHKRFGREFPGLFPQWGEIIDGQIQKVHLIGHSMGGPTSRMLAQLLAHGTAGATIAESPESHPLFSGGKNWIVSITTIASPNQGTTLMDCFFDVADLMESVVAFWFSIKGVSGAKPGMDPQLDQWNIYPYTKDEGVPAYLHRVMTSRMFAPGFKDIAPWSLSTHGAKEENLWVTTLPNVFYFSFSTECTVYNTAKDGTPLYATTKFDKLCISKSLRTFSKIMASNFTTKTRRLPESWRANDGMVNTESMEHDGYGPVLGFKGQSRPGHWMRLPVIKHVDHASIVGGQKAVDPSELFFAHTALLTSLPLNAEGITSVIAPERMVKRLFAAIESLTSREPPLIVVPERESKLLGFMNIFKLKRQRSIV